MTEAASKCATVLHLAAFVTYAYTIYYTLYRFSLPIKDPKFLYAGKWKFLTVWNFVLCGAYFGLCLLLNVIPLKFLRRLRDFIFCSVSLPSCMFVTCSFWGLYTYNPELILPKEFEAIYPKWLNHCQHTLVMATAVLEALLHRHKVPSKTAGFLGMLTWFGVYQVWILYLGNVKDVWVYPVMRILSAPQMTVYFIGNYFVLYLLHLGCNTVLRCKNRRDEDDADMELKKVV